MKEPWNYLSDARNEFADRLQDAGRFDGREKDIVFRAIELAIADARVLEVTDAMVEAGVLAYDASVQSADPHIHNLDEWQANVSCNAMRAALVAVLSLHPKT